MTTKIAVVASSIHPIRQKHLLDWYEDLLDEEEEVRIQLFLGSKNVDIPSAINYKINSKSEKLKYRILSLFKSKSQLVGIKNIQPLVAYRPQIIHLLTSNAFRNIEPILELENIKMIVSFRGFDINIFPNQSAEKMRLTQRIFKKADVLHFISEDLKNTAIKMNANPEKCVVIHRSLRTDNQGVKTPPRPSSKKVVILTIGRLVWEKGYLYALETIAILKNEGYDFEYLIVGSGIDYNMLFYHATRLNISDRVRFLGELDSREVRRKLSEADIYFQPSLSEALSLAIIEASYYRLPVVSSNIGGIPEVVEDQVSGFLSTPCVPEEYAKNLLRLMKDENLRNSMGIAANKHIINNFTREIEIQKWKEIYESL